MLDIFYSGITEGEQRLDKDMKFGLVDMVPFHNKVMLVPIKGYFAISFHVSSMHGDLNVHNKISAYIIMCFHVRVMLSITDVFIIWYQQTYLCYGSVTQNIEIFMLYIYMISLLYVDFVPF